MREPGNRRRPGLERVVATSAADSEDKSLAVPGPSGKEFTGGGADVTGPDDQLTITGIFPTSNCEDRDALQISAAETQSGTSSDWTLTGYAICADPIPNRRGTLIFSDFDSVAQKYVGWTAPYDVCSSWGPQFVLFGVFGKIYVEGEDDGQVAFLDISPSLSQKGIWVGGMEDEDGTSSNWQIGGKGLCTDSLPGLERRVETTPSNSLEKSATVRCPAGKRLLSGGGDVGAGQSQVDMAEITPNAELTTLTVAGDEDENGYAGNWQVTTYAICADA